MCSRFFIDVLKNFCLVQIVHFQSSKYAKNVATQHNQGRNAGVHHQCSMNYHFAWFVSCEKFWNEKLVRVLYHDFNDERLKLDMRFKNL